MKKTMAGNLFILGICLVTSVAQAADNAITNGIFNSTSGWVATGTVGSGSGSIVADGSGCIYVYDTGWGSGSGKWTQTVQVTPNTEYSLNWYAMPGGGGGGYYSYSITDMNDGVIKSAPNGYIYVDQWQYEWATAPGETFNSGNNNTINISFISYSGDWVAFDNVYLVAHTPNINAITNSTLHSTYGWTPSGGAQYRMSLSTEMDASGFLLVYDDSWGSGSAQWTQAVQVTPNTDCNLYWYACPGGTSGGYFKYRIADGSNNVIQTVDYLYVGGEQYQWSAFSTPTFNTGNNSTVYITFMSHSSDWVGIDNIYLASQVAANGVITNGKLYGSFGWTPTGSANVGSAGANLDGSVCIYLWDNGWGSGSGKWSQTIQGITPNTEYKLSWFACPGGTGGGYYRYSITDANDNVIQTVPNLFAGGAQYQWSAVAPVTFNSGNNTSIKVNFISHSSDWVAFDNIKLDAMISAQVTETPTFSPKGGNFAAAQNVGIFCATPNAVIRYTTDETIPTVESQVYTGPISVSQNTVLKAKAWAEGFSESGVGIASFNFPTSFNRPETIDYDDNVAVDGNLTDWATAQWAPLDQTYFGTPSDIAQAQYAAKWGANGNKIFVAIKVQDDALHLTDTYTNYDARDAVEVYVHTTSIGPVTYGSNSSTSAQQYSVGIKNDQSTVWTALAGGLSTDNANFQATGKVVVEGGKNWLVYEMAITPFDFFGGLLTPVQANVISTLSANDIIGLDVVAVGHNGTEFTGMKSENTVGGKFGDFNTFGLHKLVAAVAQIPGDANGDGMVDVGDLGILAANYGQSPRTWSQGDFNNDSIVDVGDLGILAANYGTGVNGSVDFSADYAKAFGTAAEEEAVDGNSLCSGLGLPLIAGLLLAGLMLVKLED